MGTGCIRRAAAGDQDLARTRPYAAINAVMDLVDLGVLAAAEPASALHQIVRLGLYPRPEAVAVKGLHCEAIAAARAASIASKQRGSGRAKSGHLAAGSRLRLSSLPM